MLIMIGRKKISTSSKNELLKVAQRSTAIRQALILNSTALTPVNFKTEKEKFFKSKSYNPKFEYINPPSERFDIEIDELEQRVEEIDLPYDLLYHLIEYLNHLRFLYHAKHSIGRPTFPIYAKLAFNWKIIDPDILVKSLPKFKFENEKKGDITKAEHIAVQLRDALQIKYKIKELDVEVDYFSTNMIFVDYNIIKVGKDIKRFQNNIDRLIVHEVESHALQNYNIRKSKNHLRLISKLSDSYLYSEGLGVYNEIKTGTLTKSSFQNYYYRLKSIKNSHLSFRELYNNLVSEGISEKHAYNISFRVKRGMLDTSKAGCYPKDAAYLLGYKQVLKFLKDNPIELLYYAKNPHLTKLLMKYNLIGKKEIILPKFYSRK